MYPKGGSSSQNVNTHLMSKRSHQMAYDPNQQNQQPPQYQQPGYQQPVPQSPLAQQLGPSSIGIEPNLAAALSYFWIIGLIFFFIEKKNRFVRFHALQSLLFGVAALIIA